MDVPYREVVLYSEAKIIEAYPLLEVSFIRNALYLKPLLLEAPL